MKHTQRHMQGHLPIQLLAVLLLCPALAQAALSGFEDTGATLPDESYWDGQERVDGGGPVDDVFTSDVLAFRNHFQYDEIYGVTVPYWDGFAYSNRTYTVGAPIEWPDANENMFFGGAHHAVPGAGADNSDTYAIGYAGYYGRIPTVEIPEGANVESAMITNTNYAYFTMLQGDPYEFNDAFAQDDFLLLTITGKDENGTAIDSVPFYLADLMGQPSEHIIVDEWTSVDLSELAGSRTLEFTVTGSDNDPVWGLNTPAYFAIDNIVFSTGGSEGVIPEPTSWLVWMLGLAAFGCMTARRKRHAANRQS